VIRELLEEEREEGRIAKARADRLEKELLKTKSKLERLKRSQVNKIRDREMLGAPIHDRGERRRSPFAGDEDFYEAICNDRL